MYLVCILNLWIPLSVYLVCILNLWIHLSVCVCCPYSNPLIEPFKCVLRLYSNPLSLFKCASRLYSNPLNPFTYCVSRLHVFLPFNSFKCVSYLYSNPLTRLNVYLACIRILWIPLSTAYIQTLTKSHTYSLSVFHLESTHLNTISRLCATVIGIHIG